MDSEQAECDVKPYFDDSGCVQDGSPKKTAMENGYTRQAMLLDLSDDVLLCILKFCSPHDLKALGFTCSRLGSLVLDRSLWCHVDARGVGYGKDRTQWLLTHALHEGTQELHLSGFASQARGCLGYVNKTRKQVEEEISRQTRDGRGDGDNNNTRERADSDPTEEPQEGSPEPADAPEPPYPLFRQHARLHINAHQLPRMSGSPTWHEESDSECGPAPPPAGPPGPPGAPAACAGPHFTVTSRSLRQLRERCPHLTSLTLLDCNINCNKMSISNFPPTLKKLSLRGTKCYNLPLDKSFLFKIHDYLPLLEYLDLSECSWLEPAALLPLSKISTLDTLLMKDCPGMTEFVAYVSLATRYGFRKLRVLDFRGSPVADSEVSALGWLPALQQLLLAAPAARPAPPTHQHYQGDPAAARTDTDAWELHEPDHYKGRQRSASQSPEYIDDHGDQDVIELVATAPAGRVEQDAIERVEHDVVAQMEQLRQRLDEPSNHISIEVFANPRFQVQRAPDPAQPQESRESGDATEPPPKRKVDNPTPSDDSEPGPSKRTKPDDSPKDNKDTSNKQKARKHLPDCCNDGRLSIEITFGFSEGSSLSGVQDKTKMRKTIRIEEGSNKKESDEKEENNDKKNDSDNTESVKVEDGNNQQETDKKDEKEQSDKNDCDKTENVKVEDGSKNEDSNSEKLKERNENSDGIEKIKAESSVKEEPKKEAKESDDKAKSHSDKSSDDNQSSDSGRPKSNKSNSPTRKFCIRPSTSKYNPMGNVDEPPAKKIRTKFYDARDIEDRTAKDNERMENKDTEKERRSKDDKSTDDDANPVEGPSGGGEGADREGMVRIVRNQDPVVIQCPAERRQDALVEARHHVLYVNLGQQLHAVYRLLPNRIFRLHNNRDQRSASTERLDSSSLVTDAAIRRFGRADGEDVNVVHIGPNGPQVGGRDTSGRPNRSNLRVLSVTGYRSITNRSLVHLVTAAPELRMLDFSNSGVTADGVENFRSLRPDCEVVFSTYKEDDDEVNIMN